MSLTIADILRHTSLSSGLMVHTEDPALWRGYGEDDKHFALCHADVDGSEPVTDLVIGELEYQGYHGTDIFFAKISMQCDGCVITGSGTDETCKMLRELFA